MDMEHIKPTTLTLRPILYSPTHLFMPFINRHIFMQKCNFFKKTVFNIKH
jgi:hypothetical protein